MNLQTLRTVVKIHQLGSLAAAARALNVDPSTVSKMLSGVEQHLGLRLFQRSTRYLTPTEQGLTYLRRIAGAIEEIDQAGEEASALDQQPSGRVRVTGSVALIAELLVPLLPGFHSLYPKIDLDLISDDRPLDLYDQRVDLALRLTSSPSGNLIATRLMLTWYKAVASPSFVKAHTGIRAPEDLASLPCLGYALSGFENRWRFQDANRLDQEVPIAPRLRFSNVLALRAAAEQGLGVALLANWLIGDRLRTGTLVDLLPGWQGAPHTFETAVWALFADRSYLPRRVRVLLNFLKANLERSPSRLERPT